MNTTSTLFFMAQAKKNKQFQFSMTTTGIAVNLKDQYSTIRKTWAKLMKILQ